ncbi:MAG: NADH-quinone oxidoreductase subunit M [Alphaproteobacteria bacterium]|nr:NADH-quinone oxidoreductase subunit M [Alphaproteobacteria bacterium]OJV12487.1 MAG: NADH-quinone oxidoreductase subunit M [Alphaproteobacteria bacterium 33-17]
MTKLPYLSILIFIPLIAGLLILLMFQNNDEKSQKQIRNFSLISTLATFIVSLIISYSFFVNPAVFSSLENYSSFAFVEDYGYGLPVLGVDGLALSLIMLTTSLMPICILASGAVKQRLKLYMASFLFLEAIVIGIFTSMNAILFYIMFEASLIPMFMIIGIWGGDNRIYAAMKFFLYTFLGSVLLLVAILYLNNQFSTFDIVSLQMLTPSLSLTIQKYLWLALFASFAVKIPMFPFHTWLPDAHVQAPTAGSVILAGVLLKLGGYGFLRFSIPMLPEASVYFTDFIVVLSIIAIIYASIVAFAQKDMKKMIAYSSIAHMGYVTIGMFIGLKYGAKTHNIVNFEGMNIAATNYAGYYGSIFQMISHGFVSAALFLIVGSLYDRLHTKEIAAYGGVASKMPVLSAFFMIFMLSSVGLPGTSGFVGEFLVMLGVISVHKTFGILTALGVVLGAIYMLVLYAKVMFGKITNPEIEHFKDATVLERVYYIPLAFITLLIGVYPDIVNRFITQSIGNYAKLFLSE